MDETLQKFIETNPLMLYRLVDGSLLVCFQLNATLNHHQILLPYHYDGEDFFEWMPDNGETDYTYYISSNHVITFAEANTKLKAKYLSMILQSVLPDQELINPDEYLATLLNFINSAEDDTLEED